MRPRQLPRLLPTLTVIAGLIALPFAVQAQDTHRIVANVNSQGITEYELRQRVKLTILSSRIADTPANHPAIQLRDWLLTSEGQAVVAQSGYVPLGAR